MVEEVIKNARRTKNGRKILTSEQKAYIVHEWEKTNLTVNEFCRRYGLISQIFYKWRRDASRGAVMGIQNSGKLHSKTELESLKKENEELKKALGELTLDNKILKKKVELDEHRERMSKLGPKNLGSV